MKLGYFTTTNQKGQVVIPKKIRNELKISANSPLHLIVKGNGIYMHPVKEIINQTGQENSYFAILKKTEGAWGKDADKNLSKNIELLASKKRKLAW